MDPTYYDVQYLPSGFSFTCHMNGALLAFEMDSINGIFFIFKLEAKNIFNIPWNHFHWDDIEWKDWVQHSHFPSYSLMKELEKVFARHEQKVIWHHWLLNDIINNKS